MKADLLIDNIGELVTCAGGGNAKKGAAMNDCGIIHNAAVAVVGGKIAWIGASSDVANRIEAVDVIDASNRSVVPGFVECHSHIVYAGNRVDEFELRIKGASYMEIMEAGGGIIATVAKTRAAEVSDLVEQSRTRLDRLMKLGVTTCEIKTGYGLDTASELKMLEAIFELNRTHAVDIAATFLPAHAFPFEFKDREDDYVELICREMLPRAAEMLRTEFQNLSFFADVFCERNAFSLDQSKKVLNAARSNGFKLKAHVDEFTNLGCARFAIESEAVSIDHLDAISDAEIELLASSQTVGVVTPTVNFNFGSSDFADARKMVDRGCAVAVSTDYNPGSAPCPSLPNAMAIACRYQKLTPAEALNAVTINAAFAIDRGAETGSIEMGKHADLLILSTEDFRDLSYEFGGNFIDRVIKKGVIIHEIN